MSKSLKDFAEDASVDQKRLVTGKIADLLERSGIDVEDIGRVEKVNTWQGFYKDADGVAHTQDMIGVQLSPSWETGPEWPVVQPSTPHVVKAPKLSAQKLTAETFKRAMTLPDIQIGYFFDGAGNLVPTHDEQAIDVALQLVRFVRPHLIILHGDNLDLPQLGKYRLTEAFARSTQPTIDRGGLFAAQLRAAAGEECEIIWLEGNHEFRMSAYLIDNATAAFGLRKANTPNSWPVLSVPYLCRLEEHGIEYRAGYPANEAWINDRLRVIHGDRVASNGSTAHKYLAQERVSTVFGHVHRREWAERTRATREGPRTILAMSPGCLCDLKGRVPSTKGGTDLFGMPVPTTEDWQQGVAVFQYEGGEGRFIPEQIPILDGWAIYHGKEFSAAA